MSRPKCIFIGCVELSQIGLIEIDKYFDIELIFCAPINKQKNISAFSNLDQYKLKSKPKIIKTFNVERHIAKIKNLDIKIIFCIGWPRILKSEILQLNNILKIGFHSSVLPKYRGGAPVNWALINDEKNFGSTLMNLSEGVDEGEIIIQEKFIITPQDTCRTVYLKLAECLVVSLKKFHVMFESDSIKLVKQNNKLKTKFPKRNAADGLINWNLSSKKIDNFIRALTLPYPCAFFYLDNMKIKIISAEVFKYEKKYEMFKVGSVIKVIPYLGTVIKCKNSSILIKEVLYGNLPIMLFSTFMHIIEKNK